MQIAKRTAVVLYVSAGAKITELYGMFTDTGCIYFYNLARHRENLYDASINKDLHTVFAR